LATCEKQIDPLLDMRLNEQISEPEIRFQETFSGQSKGGIERQIGGL
jgi:hypothetical protein